MVSCYQLIASDINRIIRKMWEIDVDISDYYKLKGKVSLAFFKFRIELTNLFSLQLLEMPHGISLKLKF